LFSACFYSASIYANEFSLNSKELSKNICSISYTGSFETLAIEAIDYLDKNNWVKIGDIPSFLEYDRIVFGGVYKRNRNVISLIIFSHHPSAGDIVVPADAKYVSSSIYIECIGTDDCIFCKDFYKKYHGEIVQGGLNKPDIDKIIKHDRNVNLNKTLKSFREERVGLQNTDFSDE
jgi:hypothetical protein